MAEYDDDLDKRPSPIPGFIFPVVTAVLALLVGAVLGTLITWLLTRKEPEVVEVPRELTSEELAVACAPIVEVAAEDLEVAQEKVATLERKVAIKESEVQSLEEEMQRRLERGRVLIEEHQALKVELAQAKAELVTLQQKLDKAIEEKEVLRAELIVTQEELVEQTEEAIAAREDSLANKWVGFRNNAQLQICERGGRKKMGRCRDKVKDVLDASMRDRYVHCIRSGQSVASLHEAGKGEQLPDYAEWLDEESRITRGWYILLCDPTLPEAEDLEEVEHLLAVDQLDLDDEDDFEMDGEDDQPALDDTEQPEPDVWDLDEESSSRKRDRRSRREDRVDGPSEEGRSPSLLDDLDLDELDEYDTLDD